MQCKCGSDLEVQAVCESCGYRSAGVELHLYHEINLLESKHVKMALHDSNEVLKTCLQALNYLKPEGCYTNLHKSHKKIVELQIDANNLLAYTGIYKGKTDEM